MKIFNNIFKIFVGFNILAFLIYWFELDAKGIAKFQPTYRKMSSEYRKKCGLE